MAAFPGGNKLSFLFPIKLHLDRLPPRLAKFVPAKDDPRPLCNDCSCLPREEFSRRVSSFFLSNTWKTTWPDRQSASTAALLTLAKRQTGFSLMDVGVSDGSTSLDLIAALRENFARLILADLSFNLLAAASDDSVYFYHPHDLRCLLVANSAFLFYPTARSPILPLRWWAEWAGRQAPDPSRVELKSIDLCQPELRRLCAHDSRISLVEWDIFTPWMGEKVRAVKAANLLNLTYFPPQQILLALKNLRQALLPGGYLLIVENRASEQWALYRNHGAAFKMEDGPGVDIGELVLRLGS